MIAVLVSCGNNVQNDILNVESVNLEFHMTNAMDSNFELDIKNKRIMVLNEVGVRGIPSEAAKINRTLSYQLIDVLAAVYAEDNEKWALISFFCFDATYDDIGWVKVSDLAEYSEKNYHLLRYPVSLTDDCVDLQTGEIVKWDAVAVEYIDNYAHVFAEGGWSHNVSTDSIVYPPFKK